MAVIQQSSEGGKLPSLVLPSANSDDHPQGSLKLPLLVIRRPSDGTSSQSTDDVKLPPLVEQSDSSGNQPQKEGVKLPFLELPPDSSDDEYDTDMENDEKPASPTFGTTADYKKICKDLHTPMSQRVEKNLSGGELHLRYRNLGAAGAQALALTLVKNTNVEVLDLEDNGLGGEGGMYIADMLKENIYITHLNISKNQLETVGAIWMGQMLKTNSTLVQVNLSENKFRDSDAQHLAAGIQMNESVIVLDMSKNDFSEEGAAHIARAIAKNNHIQYLDLSWNQLRRKGAVALSKGIMKNSRLVVVNLAWNGFGYEGSMAVGEMLKINNHLEELDISNNRINWQGASFIADGLKANRCLRILMIGHNPLTMTGCLDLLEALLCQTCAIRHIGFDGIPVNKRCIYLADQVTRVRRFTMTTGGLLAGDDFLGVRTVVRGKPLQILMQFMAEQGIRLLDLFRSFSREEDMRVSREQFLKGFKRAKVPLNDYEVEQLMEKFDRSGEGYITYSIIAKGIRKQQVKNREEDRKKAALARRKVDEFQRIMAALMPPMTEKTFRILPSRLTHRSREGTSRSLYRRDSEATPRGWKPGTGKQSILQQLSMGSFDFVGGGSGSGRLPQLQMSAPLAVPEVDMAAPSPAVKKKKKKRRKGLF